MSSENDDHIACELTEEDLLKLRPRSEQPTLDGIQAEQLKRQVIQAITKMQESDDFPHLDTFLDWLNQGSLADLTLAEAQNRILYELVIRSQATDGRITKPTDNNYKLLQDEVKRLPYELKTDPAASEVISKIEKNNAVTTNDLKQLKEALNRYDTSNSTSSDIATAIGYFDGVASQVRLSDSPYFYVEDLDPGSYGRLRYADNIYKRTIGTDQSQKLACDAKNSQRQCIAAAYEKKAGDLRSYLSSKKSEISKNEANVDAIAKITGNPLIAKLNISNIFSQSLERVATATHKAISAFAKPDDVGCAMAVLPWNSMRYTFGQKVADEYLGVQITVRNLNAEKEFLLHDAELAVDMDLSQPNPRHSRFFSGIDKQNVRAYMLAARDYDTRSLWVHSAESVSTLLGAVAPIWGGAVTDAASVVAGGFLPALTHVWTDSHTEQLNQLNDVGFSASRNDRTFVPKSGSTQFVIFVPVKPLEEAWWTQGCVQAIPLGASKVMTNAHSSDSQLGEAPADLQPDLSRTHLGDSRIGLDIDALRRICYTELNHGRIPKSFPSPLDTGSVVDPNIPLRTVDPGADPNGPLTYFNPSHVKYRKWTPTTYALLKELSFAVVAGTHVTLSSETHPDITQLDCPHTSIGDLDVSAAKSGTVSCSVSGVNLDKADHLTLRSASDTQTVDGPLKSANGGKVATVDFKVTDLCPLKDSAYKLYTVTKEGIEDGGTQSLHLSLDPWLTKGANLGTDKALGTDTVSVTFDGCHLDNLASVQFRSESGKSPALLVSDKEESKATLNFGASAGFSKFGLTADKTVALDIWLTSTTDQSNPRDSKQTLTIAPPAKATTAK